MTTLNGIEYTTRPFIKGWNYPYFMIMDNFGDILNDGGINLEIPGEETGETENLIFHMIDPYGTSIKFTDGTPSKNYDEFIKYIQEHWTE